MPVVLGEGRGFFNSIDGYLHRSSFELEQGKRRRTNAEENTSVEDTTQEMFHDAVVLGDEARRLGTYIIGATGAGKSTLLTQIVAQDIWSNEGVCVIDPHGDLIDDILLQIPDYRQEDVIIFSPGSPEQITNPIGWNVFDCDRDDPKQKRLVVSTILGTLYKLFHYSWGPRMEDLLRVSILTLLEYPEPVTFLDLQLLLSSASHRARYVSALPENKYVLRQFWEVQFKAYDKRQRVEVVGSSLNKIGRFIVDPLMQNIVCQSENAIDLRKVMDEKKILLVNLSKGDVGEENSSLLGAVLVNLILIASMSRRDTPKDKRVPFHLIVDEFQNFATESFSTLQSEARKYAIDVIVAHQYRDQLDRLSLGATVNVGNVIALRTTGKDSHDLASIFNNRPPPAKINYRQFYIPTKQTFKEWDISDDKRKEFERWLQDLERRSGKNLFWAKAVKHQEEDFDVEIDENLNTRATNINRTDYPMLEEYEEAPRTYSDMQSERANQMSSQGNYEAICRLYTPSRNRSRFTEYRLFLTPPNPPQTDLEAVQAMRASSVDTYGIPAEQVQEYIEERIGEQWDFDQFTTPAFGTKPNQDDDDDIVGL